MAGFRGRWSFLALLMFGVFSTLALADARTDRLVELLRNSGNYRVRVQSAQSLGRIREPRTVDPLVEALSDAHPAVRAAAALALGRIGSPRALAPLRRLSSKSGEAPEVVSQAEQAIKQIDHISKLGASTSSSSSSSSQKALYYIGVGDMGNTTGQRSGELEQTLAKLVREELEQSGGIKVAPPGESPSATSRALQQNKLKGYFVQGSVTRLEESGGQIQAVVSVMVLTNPGRDLRMMLQGRGIASIRGSGQLSSTQRRGLEDSALAGAVKGAMSRLTQQLGVGR